MGKIIQQGKRKIYLNKKLIGIPLAVFRQEGTNRLKLEVLENEYTEFDLTNKKLALYGKREVDDKRIEQIKNYEVSGNTVVFDLMPHFSEKVGRVYMQLDIRDDEGFYTTSSFYIDIEEHLLNKEIIEREGALQTIEEIIHQEEVRQENEVAREQSETARKSSEDSRETAENTRIENEKARDSQETARQEAELIRETQEAKRQENESLREEIFNQNEIDRESIFNNAQQTRDSEFTNSQNYRKEIFNLSEQDRENTFNRTEEERQNTYNTNENARQSNELERQKSEEMRIGNDSERSKAETIRQQNEVDRDNRFTEIETKGKELIQNMQETIDGTISEEVIEARGGKAKLGLRLDDMETQSVENASSIEGILQELLKCIKSDGSVAMTGNLKVVAIERTATGATNELGLKTTTGETIYFGKTEKMENNAFRLSSTCKGKVDLGASTFPWKDVWVGSYANSENGYCKLTNGLILQWGKASIEAGYSSGAGYFPIAFPEKCFFVVANPWITQGHNYSISSPLGLLIKDNTHFTSQTWEVNNGKVEYTWFAIGY